MSDDEILKEICKATVLYKEDIKTMDETHMRKRRREYCDFICELFKKEK